MIDENEDEAVAALAAQLTPGQLRERAEHLDVVLARIDARAEVEAPDALTAQQLRICREFGITAEQFCTARRAFEFWK